MQYGISLTAIDLKSYNLLDLNLISRLHIEYHTCSSKNKLNFFFTTFLVTQTSILSNKMPLNLCDVSEKLRQTSKKIHKY